MKLDNVIASRDKKTIYKVDDKVVKVFNDGFSKSDILNEALNHAKVEEAGINVPKLFDVGIVEDKWAIITEFIDGKTLEQLMNAHPEKSDEYLNLFTDIQIGIHEKKSPMLGKLKDKMNAKISASALDATTRYELHTRLESLPKSTKVLHGDFNPSNIIITPDGVAYILDWSHATQGNASADVARTYLLFKLEGKDDFAEQYLDMFCKKTDTAKQYVWKWLPIVAASQSVKGNPSERDFLLKWADVVEYE